MNSRIEASPSSSQTAVAVFSDFPGVQITVFEGSLADYLTMRSAQLAALSQLLCTEGGGHCAEIVRENAQWLASSLAVEIDYLISIALGLKGETSPATS